MQNFYQYGEVQNERIRILGQQLGELYRTNPFFILQDQIFGWWFDQLVLAGVKCYFWPAFVAGTADDVQAIFNPKTYSICK